MLSFALLWFDLVWFGVLCSARELAASSGSRGSRGQFFCEGCFRAEHEESSQVHREQSELWKSKNKTACNFAGFVDFSVDLKEEAVPVRLWLLESVWLLRLQRDFAIYIAQHCRRSTWS